MTRLIALAAAVALAAPAAAGDKADPLADAPSKFADFGKHKVHYKSIGAGKEAVVFVHGWTADLSSWRSQVPALKDRARLVLVDLPGHGKSDAPKTDYTMEFMAKGV